MNLAVQNMDKTGLTEVVLEQLPAGTAISRCALGHLVENPFKLTKLTFKNMKDI